ncbi:MAG TPA: helix-turn-helix domain-containing protein [Gemmataceae bacterium]|jgi:AraC-like DNA-binding protein/DNA-binding MarR family transcriptional regulator|nr:helix-turn-helix domain-containing protein [Gemmataceae bacterium]
MMDVMTDILQMVGAQVQIERCESVDNTSALVGDLGKQGVVYAVSRGRICVECPPRESFELEPGDALFLLGSQSSFVRTSDGTKSAEVVTGFVEFAVDRDGPETVGWPSTLHLRMADNVSGLVTRLADEVRNAYPGWKAVSSGLANALLVAAIRAHQDCISECPAHGWLRGLSDPEVGLALQLMHERPAHPWKVADLADRLSVSRSTFAARFKQVTARTPLAYLTWWRLCRAAARLRRRDGATVAQVAHEVGYETEAAFGKAFRRQFGRTPGQVRRENGGPRPPTPLQAELKKRDRFVVREQEVAINLIRSAAKLQADFSPLIERHGINPAQYNVLRILRGEGRGLPWAEVSSRLVTPHDDHEELVSSLLLAGLIETELKGMLTITARGRELLTVLDVPVLDLHRRQLAHFSPEELSELDRLLVKARRPDH